MTMLQAATDPAWTPTVSQVLGVAGFLISLLIAILLGISSFWLRRIDSKIDGYDEKFGKVYGHVNKLHGEQESKIGHVREDIAAIKKDGEHLGKRVDRLERGRA